MYSANLIYRKSKNKNKFNINHYYISNLILIKNIKNLLKNLYKF